MDAICCVRVCSVVVVIVVVVVTFPLRLVCWHDRTWINGIISIIFVCVHISRYIYTPNTGMLGYIGTIDNRIQTGVPTCQVYSTNFWSVVSCRHYTDCVNMKGSSIETCCTKFRLHMIHYKFDDTYKLRMHLFFFLIFFLKRKVQLNIVCVKYHTFNFTHIPPGAHHIVIVSSRTSITL